MAKFNPPWASVGGVARSPTTDEQDDGFSCGEADLELFNRKFQGYDAELQAILDEGGVTGTELDDTGVLQAIQALISAAIGGGDTSGYVLFTQAQARLPIFPEVITNDGVIAVTSPAPGTIRVPASASIMHRGIKPYTTSETDLSTTASKTYHLRWNPTDGFALKDLADTGSYNPTTAAESNVAFDSTYDDMLVARVVANSSNVATITNLINKDRLMSYSDVSLSFGPTPANAMTASFSSTLNWARAPKIPLITWIIRSQSQPITDNDESFTKTSTRYGISGTARLDYADSVGTNIQISAWA